MKKVILPGAALLVITVALIVYLALVGQRSDAELVARARQVASAHRQQLAHPRYVVLVDYSRSILARRLVVVELGSGRVLLRSRVSHAWNSGPLYATRFSNLANSRLSSLGTYRVAEDYAGKFGRSLRLDGLDKGVNSNARSRAIVLHPDPGVVYSAGCFMTAPDVSERLAAMLPNRALLAVIR